jgi:hypothetical protein
MGRLLKVRRADRAIGDCCRRAPSKTCEACGRLQPTREKVNETGTLVSEWVHVGEIVVIPGLCTGRVSVRICAGRLPLADRADISPATPTNAFQGRNHGD